MKRKICRHSRSILQALPPQGARLATSPHQFINERNCRVVEKLEAFATNRGRTLLELAFGWLLSKSVVASVIAGATTPEQVDAIAA
jgi:aryl-alcohol dehydrogenase-like predicted oxidoreductase